MPGKALILLIVGVISLATVTFLNIFEAGDRLSQSSVESFNASQVKNIAEAAVQMAVRRVILDSTWRTGYTNLNLMGGTVNLRLADTVFDGKNVVKVEAFAKVLPGSLAERTYMASCFYKKNIIVTMFPTGIKGSITTNSNITTLGDLVVDGRDHSNTGILISGQGSQGVWTTGGLEQKGSSTIGGTDGSGNDYTPTKPGSDSVISTLQTFPGGYPSSPDSLMGGPANGYPEGTLKMIAQSGLGGSQYVTNPGDLTYPLKGVTYVELPDGSPWNSANITGTGILIVHNQELTAGIYNINTGVFTGIVMADDIVRIHNTVIGAVIGISPNPPSGNCIGNGTGSILFSREAINAATNLVNLISPNLNSVNQQIIYWFE
ncbi:MAG: hypothetical protein HBSAPP04_12830 [Ignavibacteriaceae bacterium]|nr:MAG: hypothetical protein EDM75_00690 [Chlorobiota bacterium]GJQ32444.1 MAG: hypothetical protein HBSAPP04_12830 [Ignavibacteriaceae bacterium]